MIDAKQLALIGADDGENNLVGEQQHIEMQYIQEEHRRRAGSLHHLDALDTRYIATTAESPLPVDTAIVGDRSTGTIVGANMSNLTKVVEQECAVAQGCGALLEMVQPKEKELGGFSVRRCLPSREQQMVGPWIFFDHMGPADFPAGQGIDVRPHPHIGIATVTYLFEGEILHRDSLGSEQLIRPGDINLMVAGRGIVHSERERPEVREADHRQHGLQLWLALPEALEEMEPAFHHYPSDDIPTVNVDGVPIRVIMGAAYGVTSPVKTFATTLYAEAHLKPGQTITLPDADERGVYVASGRLRARDTEIPEYTLAIFDDTPGVVLEAIEESRIAIIGGEPFGKRCIVWNFVSSRAERIDQAVKDWKEGEFAKVPGDETEFIPFPDK